MAGSFLSKWFAHFGTEVPFRHTLRWNWNHYPQIELGISILKSLFKDFIIFQPKLSLCIDLYIYATWKSSLPQHWSRSCVFESKPRENYFLNQGSAFASLYSQWSNFKAAQDIYIYIYKQLLIMLSINGTNTTIMINLVLWIRCNSMSSHQCKREVVKAT